MTNINKYAARLQRSYDLLHKIEQHVYAKSKRYLRRSTPVFFTQQFSALTNTQFQTGLAVDKYIINNSDHCWLTEISVRADENFVWNFKLNSTDNWYRQNNFGSPDAAGGCFAQSGGFSQRNNKLYFSAPLKFVSGDSLVVRGKLLSTFLNTNDAIITFGGFRSEEMYA